MPIPIDIHTHRSYSNNSGVFAIKNIELPKGAIPIDVPVSAAWHPWHILNHKITEIEKSLHEAAMLKNVVAIGECGIDRAIETPIEFQIEVFMLHLKIAQKTTRPLIVHCVKAYSDVAGILKRNRFELPVIFHAYRGNPAQTAQLLSNNSYFSIGDLSKFLPTKAEKLLKSLPIERLFFETDNSAISIENIYLRAAEILQVSTDVLKTQIEQNFKTVFGDALVNPH
jgi:TatD DNase family protein